jgi:hypothetical protein
MKCQQKRHKKHLATNLHKIRRILFERIFAANHFLKLVDLSETEICEKDTALKALSEALLATHIAYALLPTKIAHNENVGFSTANS